MKRLILVPLIIAGISLQNSFAASLETYFELVDANKHIAYCPDHFLQSSDSSELVFIFEGAGGYSPKKALLHQLQISEESIELCEKKFTKDQCSEIKNLLTIGTKETIAHAIILEAAMPYLKEDFKHLPWLYFSQKHESEALGCLEKIINQNTKRLRIKFLSYSMGAALSLKFARLIQDWNIDTPAGFTVDPVSRSVGSLTNVLTTQDPKHLKRPENVPLWFNIYQKTDTTSLYIGIKGTSLTGADVNVNLSNELQENAKRGHVWLTKMPIFDELVRRLFLE